MTCACEMGLGMWGGMLIPGIILAALMIGVILLVRRLWGGDTQAQKRYVPSGTSVCKWRDRLRGVRLPSGPAPARQELTAPTTCR